MPVQQENHLETGFEADSWRAALYGRNGFDLVGQFQQPAVSRSWGSYIRPQPEKNPSNVSKSDTR